MMHYDALVIGGGILGCMAARNLRRWNISVALLEQEADVCTGITRANSAIVYAGYDNKPGSLKAALTVRGNANREALAEELDVPFLRCGSLLVTYEDQTVPRLEKKLQNGIRNGVPGLRLLPGPEAEAMESGLKKGVKAALYAPTTGTVNPWQLGIAAYENALQNGCEAWLGTTVTAISREEDGYRIDTDREPIRCKYIINCAGRYADWVQAMVNPVLVELILNGSDYIVLDNRARKPRHILFQERENGKGLTVVPCVEGNLLLDSPPGLWASSGPLRRGDWRKSIHWPRSCCRSWSWRRPSVPSARSGPIPGAPTAKICRTTASRRPRRISELHRDQDAGPDLCRRAGQTRGGKMRGLSARGEGH